MLNEPQLRDRFRKDPKRTAEESGITFSSTAELALMRGLSEAFAFFTPGTGEQGAGGMLMRRHPYSVPGDLDFHHGPQAALAVVTAVAAVVEAAATVVAAAAAVYSATNTKPY